MSSSNFLGFGEVSHDWQSGDCSHLQMALLIAALLHNDKGHEADVADDTNAKVIAEGLADLDTVADAKVRHLAGLDCTAHTQATKSVQGQAYQRSLSTQRMRRYNAVHGTESVSSYFLSEPLDCATRRTGGEPQMGWAGMESQVA